MGNDDFGKRATDSLLKWIRDNHLWFYFYNDQVIFYKVVDGVKCEVATLNGATGD